jgi:type IV pilus assembly protein PilM
MAKSKAVWGIDLGQCAVKALRCTAHEQPDKIVVEAFDYIEYPKILSQPEADPVELVSDALTTFLSRNSVKGDRVAISVPGQSGLARFIKLPPVETKKIPDIVRYEARQQIPFSLEEVVWDYQKMIGGMEEEGFALETEVGLFAMKREQLARALRPFQDAGIEVDVVQLTPLALYNFVVFDRMQDLPAPELYDADNPPESTVVLAMGTDATDLVVTNGFRVWQRSVPVGGNHFTKALTKELKLTFAKAEHMKRNATHAEDAKAVFQAMRPVFSDLVTEVQRSVGYYANIDRKAKIGRIVALGNAMKLPGLQRFLAQNLGLEVDRVESFRGLEGSAIDTPTFKENIPAFGVCYGLALQGLRNDVRITTNLVPPEIVRERLIRSKKPWAVAAAACLMLGLTFSFGGDWRAWNVVHEDRWKDAVGNADSVVQGINAEETAFNTEKTAFTSTAAVGINLTANVEGRLLWVEMLKAVNACLPRDFQGEEGAAEVPYNKLNQLHITQIDCQKFDKLEDWWGDAKVDYRVLVQPPAPAPDAGTGQPAAAPPADAGPTGPGWVVQLVGHHFHNDKADAGFLQGNEYVIQTLVKNLQQARVPLYDETGQQIGEFPVGELGIKYALLFDPRATDWNYVEGAARGQGGAGGAGAGAAAGGGFGGGGNAADAKAAKPRHSFVVQFCWIETRPGERAAADAGAAADPLAANRPTDDGSN